jgi:hypothetical protein
MEWENMLQFSNFDLRALIAENSDRASEIFDFRKKHYPCGI